MTRICDVSGGARNLLGEGPIWSPDLRAIFWVDIFGQQVNRLLLDSGAIASWHLPERIGWIIEREGRSDFMVGLKSGFATMRLDPLSIEFVGNPEPDRPQNRLNDAKTDLAGRIWAGSKDDRDKEATGALYLLNTDLTWSREDDGYEVPNGPAFSPDGKIMYHSDSRRRTVFAFNIDDKGHLTGKRVFLKFDESWGFPDGMTTDCEGGVWIAHWGGGRISRFTPDGSLDRAIPLPATNVTSMVFAGPDLDRMFVTSASWGCSDEPKAGSLFEVQPDARGWPAKRFGG